MDELQNRAGVWFIYDGECPMCSMAAHAFRIRQLHGPLHLIDARQSESDSLLAEIKRRNLDLDEGMVIWLDGKFYHGKDALRFMAQFGDTKGLFNRTNRILFRSEKLAGWAYPCLRGVRNLMLRLKDVGKLDNLGGDDAGHKVEDPR